MKRKYESKNFDKIGFRCWLIRNRMTATDFANKVGVSKAYISSIVNGKRHISRSIVELFAKGGYEI